MHDEQHLNITLGVLLVVAMEAMKVDAIGGEELDICIENYTHIPILLPWLVVPTSGEVGATRGSWKNISICSAIYTHTILLPWFMS